MIIVHRTSRKTNGVQFSSGPPNQCPRLGFRIGKNLKHAPNHFTSRKAYYIQRNETKRNETERNQDKFAIKSFKVN